MLSLDGNIWHFYMHKKRQEQLNLSPRISSKQFATRTTAQHYPLAKLRQIHSPPADGGVALVTRERQALLAQFSPAAIL